MLQHFYQTTHRVKTHEMADGMLGLVNKAISEYGDIIFNLYTALALAILNLLEEQVKFNKACNRIGLH